MTKNTEYAKLTRDRKKCHLCSELTNPADVNDGQFDSKHVGPWCVWQGNLNADLMVVGQDWGDVGYFAQHQGQPSPTNPTNLTLVKLVGLAGVKIGVPGFESGHNRAFFTNAILCLKEASGGLQGGVRQSWFTNCAPLLRRQIDIIQPKVIVALGERAYRTVLLAFECRGGAFRDEVELDTGRVLPNGSRVFAVYHCCARIQNTHRHMPAQEADWKRIRRFLRRG